MRARAQHSNEKVGMVSGGRESRDGFLTRNTAAHYYISSRFTYEFCTCSDVLFILVFNFFNTRIALNAPVLYVSSFEIKVRIIRVFVCSGNTIHRRMRLGPKLTMGEKNSCRVQFSDEFSPVPSRSEADIQEICVFLIACCIGQSHFILYPSEYRYCPHSLLLQFLK